MKINVKFLNGNTETLKTDVNDRRNIINYYNDCNFLNVNDNKSQVVEINFILEGIETGLPACKKSTIFYPFEFNKDAQCYLY